MYEVKKVEELEESIDSQTSDLLIVYFYAGFHPACQPGGQIDQVIDVLGDRYAAAKFIKVDAEALEDCAKRYEISVVPSFVVFKKGKGKVELVEGAIPSALQAAIERAAISDSEHDDAVQAGVTGNGETGEENRTEVIQLMKKLSRSAHVMVFMHGTRAAPSSQASKNLVAVLDDHGVQYGAYNANINDKLVDALKQQADGRDLPHVFVGGEFVGTLGDIRELMEKDNGESFKALVLRTLNQKPAAIAEEEAAEVVDDAFLKKLVNSSPAILFMKGNPATPRCGFSAKIVRLLKENGIDFSTFDILENNEVREKLKVFADWPTYPQFWVDGSLVGGLDILLEMAEDGPLGSQLGISS